VRFADTSFWFALQRPHDRNHAVATTLATGRSDLVVTTNHVVGETWTLLRSRYDHAVARGFLDRLRALPNLEVFHAPPELEADALRWLRRHDERPYSFVDAVSFATMRRRRIIEALAFDADFAAAGFVELRP
jgi:predicted nucleic acid-binding protein